MFRTRLACFVLLTMLLLGFAGSGQSVGVAAAGPGLGPDMLTLTLSVPAYTLTTDEQGYARVVMEGAGDDLTPGRYLLPVQELSLALPPDALLASVEVSATVLEAEVLPGSYRIKTAQEATPNCATAASTTCARAQARISDASTLSAQLAATRSVAQAAPAAPEQAAVAGLSRVGQMRKWMVAGVNYAPFRYDAASGALSVAKRVEVTLRYQRDASRLDPRLLQDRVLDAEASEMFANATPAQEWYASAADATASAVGQAYNQYDYVIITTQDIVDNSNSLSAFVAAKEERGHNVWVVTQATYDTYIGQAPDTRADKIRKFLQENYVKHGIEYVLLIGDPDPFDAGDPNPTVGDVVMKMTYPRLHATYDVEWPNAPTDYYYADLTGNWDLDGDQLYGVWPEDATAGGVDFIAEVEVGRIPSYLPRDYGLLDHILDAAIEFMNRSFWADEYRETSALLPMGFQAPGYDGAIMGDELRSALAAQGYSHIWTMYQQEQGSCSSNSSFPSSEELDAELVPVVVNRWASEPFGLVVWWAHGSAIDAGIGYGDEYRDCWDGDLFTSADAQSLDDDEPAFAFLNSCLNGTPERGDNLGYALLANGARGTVSASRVSWFHTDQTSNFVAGATNASLARRFAWNMGHGQTAGHALTAARVIGVPTAAEHFSNYLVFNLYGDPGLMLTNRSSPFAPDNPTNFQVVSLGGDQYRATWTPAVSDSENGFRLQRQEEGTSAWLTMVMVGADVETATFTNDRCGSTFKYRVAAFNEEGASASNEASITRSMCVPNWPLYVEADLQNGAVDVTWTPYGAAYGPEEGFRVYRRLASAGASWQQVGADIPAATHSFRDATIECDKTYEYMVRAYNAAGESEPSGSATAWSGYCPPSAPTNLHQTGSTPNSITFAWQDNSAYEVSFSIQRKTVASGGVATYLPAAPAGATSYTDADPPLPCGATRYYRVGAKEKYATAWGNWVQMSTAECSRPAAPSALTASTTNPVDPTHVYLSWSDNSDNESGFQVERSVNNGAWTQIGTTNANQTAFKDAGQCSTLPRRYRVRSYNDVGSSLFTNLANATLADCNPYGPVLSAARGASGQVILWWTDQSAPGATTDRFVVRYVMEPFQYGAWLTLTNTLASNVPSYAHLTPACDHALFYAVQAIDGANVYASDVVSLPASPCTPAALEAGEAGRTTLQISWDDRSDIEDGFKVYKQGSPQQWTEIADVPANVTAAQLTGFSCGVEYSLSVRAYTGEGAERLYSARAEPLDTATLPCIPTAPAEVSVTGATSASISLQWSAVNPPVDGYRILRRPAAENTWVQAGQVGGQTTAFTDAAAALNCRNKYIYAVTAFNAGGTSSFSPVVIGGTRPCAPAGVAARAVSAAVVLVTWTPAAPGAGVSGYTVQDSTGPLFSRSDTVHTYPVGADKAELRLPLAECGRQLYYRVLATNAYGDSSPSAAVTLTVACIPAPPAQLAVAPHGIGPSSVSLRWEHTGENADGFILATSNNGSSDWRDMAKIPAAQTTYTVGGLRPGSVRYFRVRAFNSSGASRPSATLRVQTTAGERVYLPMLRR